MNKGRMWQMSFGFDPASGPAVAEPGAAGASGGGSPAPQPGAGAPPPASPAGTPPGPGAAPRTYTGDDVSRIVQERLSQEQKKYEPYKNLGDPKQLSDRLARLDKLEKALRGDGLENPQSAEERELRELVTKLIPGVDKVSGMEERLASMEARAQQGAIKAGQGVITGLAKEKFGDMTPESLSLVEGAVSASIGADKEALARFFSGDTEAVVREHFGKVFEKQFDPFLRGAAARYSSGKATDKSEVPPPTPKGGIQAPITNERKLSAEERRDAAWKRMQELEGRGDA